MLKSVSICAALILAAAVFADSAEARPGGFGGGRSMGGFGGARMGGFSGLAWRFSGAAWPLPVMGEWDRRSGQVRWSYAHGSGPSCLGR